jgi:hypothetical protein
MYDVTKIEHNAQQLEELVSMLHHYYDQREKVFESQTSTS